MANENRIGALWLKEKGPFAKGSIKIDGKEIKIVMWKNTRKQPGEKYPDFHIDIDTWVPGQGKVDTPHVEQVAKTFDGFSDDIPF